MQMLLYYNKYDLNTFNMTLLHRYDFTTENMTILMQMGRFYVIIHCTANMNLLHRYDITNANVTHYLDYDFTI